MNDHDRREAALDWLVRTNDPEFDGWAELTAWLEQDQANADAYHALAQSEAELRPFIESIPSAQTRRAPERKRLALAASIAVLAASATAIVGPRLMPVELSSPAGQTRVVSLGGQDRLVMNGSTRIKLTGWDRRKVELEQGQVLLKLHDENQGRIQLRSGDLLLVDIGTVFEVSRDGQLTRVLVSEGALVADPQGAELKLSAGQRLDTHDGATVLQAALADRQSVGGFERGQLVYVDEPLTQVLADLRRSTGLDFSVDRAISARRFTGTLSVAEVKRDPMTLGPLVGVPIKQSGGAWKLGGRT